MKFLGSGKMYKYDYEVVEVCPHCDTENIYEPGEAMDAEYIATCKNCGKKIFLCDQCMHSLDNLEMCCDWCQKDGCDVCMRGRIKMSKELNKELLK